jgi:D-alanyl-D-alanine carboxypeptidase
MEKILSGIVAFLLSANTYTVAYSEKSIEENDGTTRIVKGVDVQENVLQDELSPIKGRFSTNASSSTNWWSYPSDIKGVTRSGDDLLVLVNKEYQLPSTYAPSDLVSATLSGIRKGENFLLRNILINDLKELVTAAINDSIDLSIRSGYRSYSTQIATYNHWLSLNGSNIAAADKISARAGHSQHQLGTAVDFSSSEIADGLGGTFASTKASKWLAENAWKYGFVISFPAGYESITGYSYESWHYRYIGKTNAKEMINSGIILELYLRGKN